MSNENMIDHPPHYTQGKVECIEAILSATGDGGQHFLQGNIIKYIWRYKHRHGIQDLKKAQWYLNALIECVENETKSDTVDESIDLNTDMDPPVRCPLILER